MRAERWVAVSVAVVLIVGATAAQVVLRQGEPSWTGGRQSGGPAAGTLSTPERSPAIGAGSGAASAPTSARTPSSASTGTQASPTATPVPAPTAMPTPTPTPAGPVRTGSDQPPTVGAAFVAVVDEDSGRLLYDKGAHRRVAPASLTKIATALVALERGDPRARVRVRFDAAELVDSTLMGLHQGDEVSLEDLLYGLMLPSGNDAALAIAEHIAGSKAGFVQMMNDKVRELGLRDTQFRNPHGLDEEGHYSSAYDMVMLASYGMRRYPLFVKLAGARAWTVRSSRGPYEIYNLNRFLLGYEGADGVKIGYTEAAGRTIVASATRKGHRVYVGLMQSADLVADTTPLMDYVFANYTWPSGS